jgi:hypothetical protein
VSEILTAEQASGLAERIREAIPDPDSAPRRLTSNRRIWTADLRTLDRWLRALHRAHDGLDAHEPDGRLGYDGYCECERYYCPDARRYTDAAADASDALRDLEGLYGVEVLA